MNPPPFLEIDEELLALFKQACEKYIATCSNDCPEVMEIVVSILLGEEWPICNTVAYSFAEGNEQYFVNGLYNLLPLCSELISKKRNKDRNYYNNKVEQTLREYLSRH